MRNFLLLLTVAVVSAFYVNNAAAQYCTPPGTTLYNTGCTDDDYIRSFSTTGGASNITNNNTGCSNATTGYTFFNTQTHSGVQGTTVNFSLSSQNTDIWDDGYKIWVDWNGDGTFNNTDELVYSPTALLAPGTTVTGSFTIPPTATPGLTRLRVRCVFNTSTFTACSNHTYGEVEDYNFQVVASAPCAGTPNAGSATSTITNILCPGANFTLGLSGSSLTSGLTYQWESSLDNVNWSPISGATALNYTTTQTEAIKYYRAIVTCTNVGGGSATSNPVTVTNGSGPTYVPLPYVESFENTWMNTCNTREIPNNSWRNTPGTGNNSWRRNDDGAAAAWTTPAGGAYTPAASDGSFSARFHTNGAAANATGTFDLHLNCNTPATTKRLQFDYINTSGNDSISIQISTNGGTSFTRLDSIRTSAIWKKKTLLFTSNSATTIIRFIAYSDAGSSDFGIDNFVVTNFDDCSGTPVGGTAVSNAPASVCPGTFFTLNVTGQTAANLLTHQWEASTDGGVTWTPIPGATTETFVTTQNVTTQYRIKITCTNGGAFATSTSVTVNTPPTPNGVYTINKNAATTWPGPPGSNFNSFAAAVSAMATCGIGGPVRFNVVAGSGPYTEQLILTRVNNSNANNTITFNGNNEILTFATTATERAVIKLNGADYFRFENLVINPTGASNAVGVHITNDADSNIIRNCTINSSVTATANSYAGVVISGSPTDPVGTGTTSALCDGNEIRNNIINGGFYGITLSATFAGGANGYNKFVANQVRDFYQYGMYVQGSYATLIDSNTFTRPTRTNTATTVEGIYFTNQSNTSIVSRNRIVTPFGGIATPTQAFNGINFNSASASAGNDNTVVNNLIADIAGSGTINGIINTSSSNVSYFHNTISLDNIAATGGVTRGFYQTGTAGQVLFYNNMVSITRGGAGLKHAIYLATNLILSADYNNYYVNATNGHVGYFGSNRSSLTDWRNATAAGAFDINSWAINPVFINPATGDYCAANAGIDNRALYIGVDVDINGNSRNQATPDIGAFECTPPPCNIPPVNGTTVVSPTTTCENTPIVLNLNIGAYGSGQTFQWQYSTTGAAGTYLDLGNPKLTPDTTINAGTPLVGTVWLRVKVSCTSSVDYSNPVQLVINPAFPGGVYTINNSAGQTNTYVPGISGGNFTTFNLAYNAMAACGITGGVTFNVDGGPFDERLKMDSIKGTSALNTIVFNGNGKTIRFDAANLPTNTERAVIKLIRADYITFDSLTIDASAGGTYGYGVQLVNNADNNTFTRCNIISTTDAASISSAYAGVVINATEAGVIAAGNTLCDNNLFDKNTITGGYYGVTLVGGSGALIQNNKFTNNKVREFYSVGFYVAGTNNSLIEGNIIERPTRPTFTTTYGIFVTAVASDNLTISKNRIRNLMGGNPASTLAQYGIYHNSVSAAAGGQNVISNNLISNLGGQGLIFGLYNIASANIHYYHNTISIDSTNSTAAANTRGFYQQSSTTGIEFKNNIITITRGGNGAKHAIYIDNTTSDVISNNNIFYVNATNAFTGWYNGANRLTLNDWKTASGKDANSLNADPIYRDPANGDFRPSIQTVNDKGTTSTSVAITTDIENVSRSNPPDIGAYEFSPITCTTPPVAGTATVTPNSGVCLQVPITLNVTGHSQLGSLTFQWQTASSSSGPWNDIGPLQYTPRFDTLTMPTNWFRSAVTCNGNTTYTTPVQVNMNLYLLAGTYTIGNGATNWTGLPGQNFATWQEAVNAMICGIGGAIVFDVYPGTYNEQIKIPNIKNVSAANTVTFQSFNGNPASANLTFASTAANNYTLRLDSASYFRFRNLSFTATDATYGRVIDFAGNSSNDSLVGCLINTPAVATTSTLNAAVYAAAFKGLNNVIKQNTITNGSMGIYWQGTSSANPSFDHLIDSNIVSGAYFYGIYTSNQRNLRLSANTVNSSAPLAPTSYAIYVNDCDSGYNVLKNKVNISNAATAVYGIYLNNNDKALTNGRAMIHGNTVTATTNNTGALWGMYVTNTSATNTASHEVRNNVIAINTTSTTAYGLYSNNTSDGNYYNNTINNTSPNGTTANAAARFENSSATGLVVRNNIFSHKGGGRALYVNNSNDPSTFNYNMLYTTGAVLAQRGTPAGSYATLAAWSTATGADKWSIAYPPAFVSDADPRPNLGNPDVWAMHGRGIQITGNNFDINDNPRPVTLTTGVPDLGAYEFFPTALPTVLTATPATPAANTTQLFMYGTDTVMRIKWGNNVPATIDIQRFSGVVPPKPPAYPSTDSMYFYTQVNVPGGLGTSYDYKMDLYYLDPWQGSVPDQYMIGLGRRISTAWVVGFGSRVNTQRKMITDSLIAPMDKFTGFINPYAPPPSPDKDSSNAGKRFWVAYAINQLNGGQDMVLYLSAQSQPANVTVKINGTGWVRNYFVPAGTVTVTETLPKTGPQNAFLNAAGKFDQGISIESDVPIVAYGHCYGSASSGAVMLLPVGVWGYEYKTLGITQDYGAGSYSYFYVIADNDNTLVEITPSQAVQNAGMAQNVPYQITLNRGQVFQVVASSQTTDLTGSVVKSVPNAAGKCYPIATFSGSSRTAIDQPCGGGGDFIMQQNFPATAWGMKYLTAPTSASTLASNLQGNKYRIAVKDPATVVTVNGNLITGAPINATLVGGHYYEFVNNVANYIVADQPIMVAQYMSGACTGVGDPEMIYISPIDQAIRSVAFYRNTQQAITQNYVTLIVPSGGTGLTSLQIKDNGVLQTPDYVYAHPNLAGYTVVVKGWASAQRQVTVTSDSAFTGITYGQGSVESYGYNVGTLVKNIRAIGTIRDTLSILPGSNDYTCQGAPLRFTAYLPVIPTKLTWKFGSVAGLNPSKDTTLTPPVPTDSIYVNGIKYYQFALPTPYYFTQTGIFPVQVEYEHPSIEACDKKGIDVFNVQVVPSPKVGFSVAFSGCEGDVASFTADPTTSNGIAVSQWKWTFHNGTNATTQTSTFNYTTPGTYNVNLNVITPEGCIGDSAKPVIVNPRPTITLVKDSIAVCLGADTTFSIQSPLAGATYNWYTSATGGTPITTGGNIIVGTSGTTFKVLGVNANASYFVEAVSGAGCSSVSRTQVKVEVLQGLAQALPAVTSQTANSITFSWPAVPGAASYQVAVNGSSTFVTPSTGATGLSHTISGLGTLANTCIVVRAIGLIACQTSTSASVCGCTNSPAVVTTPVISVCTGTPATFTIQSPAAGVTYNWYTTATGGTIAATGSTFTSPAISGTTNYYVEQVSGVCTGSPRTQVTANVLAPLAPAVIQNPVADADRTANSVTFRWTAVPGAATYQVSIDNGTTWSVPSSGASGLSHTVTGLQPLQQVCIKVRAVGTIACQTSEAGPVCGVARPDAIFIPNTFTPNGDGKNDVLSAYGFAIQSIQFMVFNQWGEKIYEVTNSTPNAQTAEFRLWDGKYQGKVQPVGVYVYAAKITLKDGTVINKSGALNIVR